jgi:regulator of protease activity HflC (stomatin/prohibitin superfamily)
MKEKQLTCIKTLGIGAVVTSVFVFVAVWFVPEQIWTFPYTNWSAALLALAIIGLGGVKHIEVGFVGSLLFVGKRTDYLLTEGYHWLGPLFLSFRAVDTRDQTLKLDPLVVFTKGAGGNKIGAKVTVDGSVIFRVRNPRAYLSLKPDSIETGLDDIYDEVIRSQMAEKTLDEALRLHVKLSQEVLERATTESERCSWGIEIVQVPLPSIMPDPEVAADLALKRREEAQRDGEIVELQHTRDRIRELMEMGFSREQAIETVQIAVKRVTKEIKETKISVSDQTLAAIIGLANSIAAGLAAPKTIQHNFGIDRETLATIDGLMSKQIRELLAKGGER